MRLQYRLSKWLDASANALETAAAWIERHQLVVPGAFSVCYFGVMFSVARLKPFWFDELFTYYLSTLPSVEAVIAELEKGVDHHPLAYFLLMRGASNLWSDPHVSFRIPSIVGFWLLSVCLFRFVARRTSVFYGTIAMLAPHMTGAHTWVMDARPYGPAVGLLALGFTAWQSATMMARRFWPLLLLAVAIGGAISMNYYSVLALVPLGIAELVRTAERRKIDFPLWLAMVAGASVGLLYLPTVLRSVGQFASDGWARPRLWSVFWMYQEFFEEAIWFWLGCLLILALLLFAQRWGREASGPSASELPRADLVLGAGLFLLPLLGLAVAFAVTKMITARYVISTVTGFSILLSFIAYRAARGRAIVGAAIVSIALCAALFNYWSREQHSIRQRRTAVKSFPALVEQAPVETAGLPVVFENPLHLFEASHYADPALARRFVFLSDPESSVAYSGTRYTGRGMTSMQRYAPLRIEEFATFRRSHPRFLLYETRFIGAYVLEKLLDEGAELKLLGRQGDATLYLVH